MKNEENESLMDEGLGWKNEIKGGPFIYQDKKLVMAFDENGDFEIMNLNEMVIGGFKKNFMEVALS